MGKTNMNKHVYESTEPLDIIVHAINSTELEPISKLSQVNLQIQAVLCPVPYWNGTAENGESPKHAIWVGKIVLKGITVAQLLNQNAASRRLYLEFAHPHEHYFGGYISGWQETPDGSVEADFSHASDPDYPNSVFRLAAL